MPKQEDTKEITKKRTRSQVNPKGESTEQKVVKTIKLNDGKAKKVEVSKKQAAQKGDIKKAKPK